MSKQSNDIKTVLKHILRILVSVVIILILNKFYRPKDFLVTIGLWMGVYIFISIVIELIFEKIEKRN